MSSTRTLKTKTARRYRSAATLEHKVFNDWTGSLAWVAVRELFVNIVPRSGRLAVEGQQEREVIKYDIYTPWHMDGYPPEEKRIVEGDRRFYIESAVDVMDEHREHRLVCTLSDESDE